LPAGAVVLLASKGDDRLIRINGYRAWHFPRHETGVYAGHHPSTSVEALIHVRHLYERGAQYLVFPWTARWWLDHYEELADHLNHAHQLVATEDGVCIIYRLVASDAFAAFARPDGDDVEAETPVSGEVLSVVAEPRSVDRASLRVLTVLARFGTDQYGQAVREINEWFAGQMPAVERTLVVVDNARPRYAVERQEDIVIIGGDNSASEFSAFDRAIDFIGADIWSYDLVHFTTSAFNRLYVAYLDRFDAAVLRPAATRPLCIGHIDCYNKPVEVLTYHSQHWIRSCFFFLAPTEAKALGSFVSVADPALFFSGSPLSPFRPAAPLDQQYRDYITQWLTGQDVGQGVAWHSSFALTADTLATFERKAQAILNEHLLSVRLRALGCHLVDVTWLSTMLRRAPAEEIVWATPWRDQLANRDRDRVAVPDQPPIRIPLTV
jgi:hypothetical protein